MFYLMEIIMMPATEPVRPQKKDDENIDCINALLQKAPLPTTPGLNRQWR